MDKQSWYENSCENAALPKRFKYDFKKSLNPLWKNIRSKRTYTTVHTSHVKRMGFLAVSLATNLQLGWATQWRFYYKRVYFLKFSFICHMSNAMKMLLFDKYWFRSRTTKSLSQKRRCHLAIFCIRFLWQGGPIQKKEDFTISKKAI